MKILNYLLKLYMYCMLKVIILFYLIRENIKAFNIEIKYVGLVCVTINVVIPVNIC